MRRDELLLSVSESLALSLLSLPHPISPLALRDMCVPKKRRFHYIKKDCSDVAE